MVSLRILSLFAAHLVRASENKVFAPDGGNGGPILILFPSSGVPSENYDATVVAIQKASEQSLWGVIASTELGCDASLQAAFDAAAKEGWAPEREWWFGSSAWLVGHEDNETCAEKMLANDAVSGAIFMGALPGDDFDLANSKPTFILSAELHGGAARPGRAVTWWKRRAEMMKEAGAYKVLLEKPMAILPRQNSSNFCPGFDVSGDLEAEVDQATATTRIGTAVGGFIDGIYKQAVFQIMLELVETTEVLLKPLLDALDMEHISTGGLDVNGSSPFCDQAQWILAGLSSEDQARIELVDQYSPRLAYNFHTGEDPTGTLMHCHGNTSAGDKLTVKLCSYAGHDGANSSNASGSEKFRFYDGAAAGEIGCKMTSSDYLALKLNTTAVHNDRTCADVNRYAFETAQGLLSSEQAERWQKRGRGICAVADYQTPNNVGPLWIYGTTNYTETESCLQVSGYHLKLGVDEAHLPGVEYCKLMSPAFAVDYLLTGSMQAIATRTIMV